jgi:urea transport system ATP-binding protein
VDVLRAFGEWPKTGEVDVTHGRILYLEDVSVSFDGFKAINKLSLDIAPGELRCIIGPNGAGKTTMMDIITGKTRPNEGTVFFGSTINLLRYTEPEIAQLGIGRKFQKPTVFEQLTVFENLELALQTNKGVKSSMFFSWTLRRVIVWVRCCTPSTWRTVWVAWQVI